MASTTSINPLQPTTSLSTFIANAFFGVLIQDDDKIAKMVYEQNWSRDVDEVNNGNPLTFAQFRTFLFQTRAAITNRQLVSESFVIAPADAEGNTGQVAHTSHLTGEQGGEIVKVVIVSVLKVVWVLGNDKAQGRRQVVTESFVLSQSTA